jgi:hypothetical protein
MASNRYDFMTSGTVADSKTGSLYPDPLSLNYLGFKMSELPTKKTVSIKEAEEPWRMSLDVYGRATYEDVVLTLNGVSHSNFLKEGDTLYFPREEDLTNSFNVSRS